MNGSIFYSELYLALLRTNIHFYWIPSNWTTTILKIMMKSARLRTITRSSSCLKFDQWQPKFHLSLRVSAESAVSRWFLGGIHYPSYILTAFRHHFFFPVSENPVHSYINWWTYCHSFIACSRQIEVVEYDSYSKNNHEYFQTYILRRENCPDMSSERFPCWTQFRLSSALFSWAFSEVVRIARTHQHLNRACLQELLNNQDTSPLTDIHLQTCQLRLSSSVILDVSQIQIQDNSD